MGLFSKKDDGAPKPLETYKVIYKGGLVDLPKSKAADISMQMWDNRFEFHPTFSSKKFWNLLVIPYSSISDISIVDRQVSTFESIAGGLDSRQLNQKNNIHITYTSPAGDTLLRFEMLSGVTVMGQAAKCQEFEDRLRTHRAREQFAPTASGSQQPSAGDDVPAQITKLAELNQQGILSDEEFAAKKAELLSRM